MFRSRCYIQYVSRSGRPSSGHWTGKDQFSSQFPRIVLKNMLTPIALFSHANVLHKILHFRLQDYVNQERPDVQAEFRKGRGTRDQISNIHWIIDKAREFPKGTYLCFIDYPKTCDCWIIKKLRKDLQEIGIPDHLTCLLRNLYAGQEATVRPLYGTTDWFKIKKGLRQGCLLSPCLFNLYAEHIMRDPGWMSYKPTPVFCLENPLDRGAWGAIIHSVTKCWTGLKQLSTLTFKHKCIHTHTHTHTHTLHLYPFIFWWTPGLLSYLSYCK